MVEKSIAIILARGGSKRIPNKNIIQFCGQPLIAWTIQAALASDLFSHVLVSTDSKEIAEISKDYGALVPFLRKKAMDDFSTSSLATCAALEQSEAYWGIKFDYVTQLMANCPLRNKEDIKISIENFLNKKALSQISCFKYGWMNPWWAIKINSSGKYEKLFPKAYDKRSQDLQKLYCPSGAIWIAQRDSLVRNKDFYMKGCIFAPLDWISSVDIDDYEDLEMAKVCFNLRNSSL